MLFLVIVLLWMSAYIVGKHTIFPSGAPKAICNDCNIIVVALDTVGAAHLPCYGYYRDTAPNLCRFASENVLFERAYANSTWTLPSDISMLTSLYPQHHGVVNYAQYDTTLPERIAFLPEILKDNGYHTIFAIPQGDRAFPLGDVYGRGISEIVSVGLMPDENLDVALDTFAASVASGNKTFMYLHSYKAHGPYVVSGDTRFTNAYFPHIPDSWDAIYDRFSQDFYTYIIEELSGIVGTLQAPVSKEFFEQLKNASSLDVAKKLVQQKKTELESYYTEYYYLASIDLSDSEQVAYVEALYDQLIYELDEWIGQVLLPFLDTEGIRDTTIVLFTSEHGEEFLEHGRITHETLYDTNVHVPFILSVPGLSAITVSDPVQGIDVAPTILDLVGISPREHSFDGVSMAGVVMGESLPERTMMAFQYNEDCRHTVTVRDAVWKAFFIRDGGLYVPYELYNTKKDPQETQNVLIGQLDIARRLMRSGRNTINSRACALQTCGGTCWGKE